MNLSTSRLKKWPAFSGKLCCLFLFMAFLFPQKGFNQTTLDYYNLQFPFTANISAGNNVTVYAQVYQAGLTEANGQPAGINCWIGYSSSNVNPSDASFSWVAASYNSQNGNNDEFKASIGSSLPAGTFYYASRWQRNGGGFMYGGTNGAWNGTGSNSGVLTVTCNTGAPDGSTSQSFSAGATVASLVANGPSIQWYADASGGSPLSAVTILIDGTHYYASQTINGCESNVRLNVTVSVGALPTNIDFVNLQFPASATIGVGGSATAYARVYTGGVTEANGAPAGILCWIGYSSNNIDPSDASFTWVAATYNSQNGNDDEFQATFGNSLPQGTYYYASRFQRNGGAYYYGGIGGIWGGGNVSAVLTVSCAATPTGNANQSVLTGATVADLVATGSDIQWYLDATGGSPLDPATGLFNNTHYYASQTIAGCESQGRLDVTVSFLPTSINFYNLQYPPTADISTGGSVTVYAQVYEGGVTDPAGAPAGITCWIGYSSSNVFPSDASFTWVAAAYNAQSGNNDEFQAGIGSNLPAGTYYYASRFQRNNGPYYYGGTQGAWGGSSISGVLTVACNVAAPTGSSTQSFGTGATVADINATGTAVQWYADATGGIALSAATLLVNGTHYYGSQTIIGCESTNRLDVTVSVTAAPSNIDFVTLQFPPSASIAVGGSVTAYTRIYTAGVTEAAGAPAGVSAWIGYSSSNVNPSDASYTWVAATYNAQIGNDDEFQATFGSGLPAGTYYYAARFQRNDGAFYYGGLGGFWSGSNVSGVLYVNCNPVPTGNASQTFSAGATVASLVASGSNILWYTTATGGTALSSGTFLINNTHYYASQTVAGCESSERLDVTVTILPSTLAYYNLQFPFTADIATGGSVTVYAQVYEAGLTEAFGAPAAVSAWVGYSSSNVNPADPSFTWVAAGYNAQAGNNDEFQASIGSGLPAGTYYYASRFQRNGGAYLYGGTEGAWGGSSISGVLTVACNTPATPVITALGTTALCTGGSVTLSSSATNGNQWYKDGGLLPGETGTTYIASAAGSYTVTASIGGCESLPSAAISVTISPLSIPAPVITGVVNICPYIGTGEEITYTATSAGASSFTWITPPNVTVLSGAGTASLTVVFGNGFGLQNNRQFRVTANSACGTSTQTIYYLLAQAPNTPAPIVAGSTNVCAIIGTASTITYTIPAVTGATSYVWTNPAGTNILHPNGSGINDITVTLSFTNAFVTGNLTVAAANDGCGTSNARSLTINKVNASTPSPITGPTNVCAFSAPGGTPAVYAVAAVAGVTYNWTVPAGAINLTGQGTASISFTYPNGFTTGAVSVTASNGCGSGTARSLSVTRLNPSAPSAIDVIQTAPCPDRVYTYSVSGLPANATSIQWTVPGAAINFTGQGTATITVTYPSTSVNGTVTATATSNCSSSTARLTTVRLPACAPVEPPPPPPPFAKGGQTAEPVGNLQIKIFPNPAVTDFKIQVLSGGKEKITVRILDMQGRILKNFLAAANQTFSVGNDLNAGTYLLELRQGSKIETRKLVKF